LKLARKALTSPPELMRASGAAILPFARTPKTLAQLVEKFSGLPAAKALDLARHEFANACYDAAEVAAEPHRRYNVGPPVVLSRRVLTLIQLASHGHFDRTADEPLGLEAAAKIVHLQKRSLRRLVEESELFREALRAARAEADSVRRARQEAQAAPPAPLAVNPPVIAAAPVLEAFSAPPASERDTPDEQFFPVIRLDATSENVGALVRPPADFAEPDLASYQPPATHPVAAPFDIRKYRETVPFEAPAAQRARIISSPPRRSLRRS
jgi:hypothetical protein